MLQFGSCLTIDLVADLLADLPHNVAVRFSLAIDLVIICRIMSQFSSRLAIDLVTNKKTDSVAVLLQLGDRVAADENADRSNKFVEKGCRIGDASI